MNEFFRELGDRKVSIAVFFTVCGALVGIGIALGGALFELSNVSKKTNAMVGRVNSLSDRVANIEGQSRDKNRAIESVSNQAIQNSIYINGIASKIGAK